MAGLVMLFPALAFAQYSHYQPEYTRDTPIGKQAWLDQKSGLHVSFASTDKAWFRTEVPQLEQAQLWEASGWRGERLNAQILIWSPDSLLQVRIELTDLVNAKGKRLNSRNIRLKLIRYVLSNYPYGAKDAVCGMRPA
jgi:hypothetical protein